MNRLSFLVLPWAALTLAAAPGTLTVQVDQPGHPISPLLWGIFFEDINLSADGGIYPELVRNRSFEDGEKPEFWKLENGAGGKCQFAVDNASPLNPLNRRHLRVRLDGACALVNEGYWGMSFVEGEHYQVRLAARAAEGFQGPLQVTLANGAGKALATGEIAGLGEGWKWYDLEMVASGTDPKGRLVLNASGRGTLWLDMVSVLPKKTWKGHGLRPDLCEMIEGLKPAFLRFPGGCWVEGNDAAHMYQWKKTIGDVAHRQPLYNIWQYQATHGLGYHEYLQLAEDLGAEPLFCINVGMSHQEIIPMDQMGQWVQDALDAVEYANGPVDSVWGGLRARNGHPAPFGLKYLEIGNENGGPAYRERWTLFCQALKARYPEVQLIANVSGDYPTNPMPDIIDEHYYSNPDFFIGQAQRYDKYDRKGPKVFIGEYAVTEATGLGNLRGAIGEAAFMTGMERNSDVVSMGAYAPLFVNVNHKRWPINLINFDSSRAFGLPSYYVQQLFSVNRGDVVLPLTLELPEEDPARSGAVGVGTWETQAEFKDLRVTRNGETLFASDFAEGLNEWNLLGGGDWQARDGVLRQSSTNMNVRAVVGDKSWTDYTYSLKARKLGGAEGFLILFQVGDENAKSWWNIGGWGNRRHGIEVNEIIAETPGSIETDRWYDIRVEVRRSRIQCYLDGKLMHDTRVPHLKALYASASLARKEGEAIVKVVNASAAEVAMTVNLAGAGALRSPGKLTVLTSGSPLDENTLDNPTKVVPKTRELEIPGTKFPLSFPANSVTVLRVKL